MAIVGQNLFSWQEVDAKSDLQRLKSMLQVIPDEKMMKGLDLERGQGRDDYPIRAVWNSILAGVIYEHKSVESLRRELKRNPGLREMVVMLSLALGSIRENQQEKMRSLVTARKPLAKAA